MTSLAECDGDKAQVQIALISVLLEKDGVS